MDRRLHRVAQVLARHGQHDLAREAISLSRQVSASGNDVRDYLENIQESAEAEAKHVDQAAKRYTQQYGRGAGLPPWVGQLLDAYENLSGSFWIIENAASDALKKVPR